VILNLILIKCIKSLLVTEFLEKLNVIKHEQECLKDQEKELFEEYESKIDMKEMKAAFAASRCPVLIPPSNIGNELSAGIVNTPFRSATQSCHYLIQKLESFHSHQ
jgi:hypothetical protein